MVGRALHSPERLIDSEIMERFELVKDDLSGLM